MPATTMASSIPNASAIPSIAYEEALTAYNSGDMAMALNKAKGAASTGDIDAQMLAGHILKSGTPSASDLVQAAKWFRKAAALGNSDAMVALGEIAFKGTGDMEPSEAKDWFTQAAQLGRTDAMRSLADMYLKGVGIKADPIQGRDWLILAAEQGDVLAARRMGDVYIDADAPTALRYYERAADLGDPESAYIAAIMYAENLKIKPNQARAAELMKIAALASHPAAMADYGLLVYQGLAGDGTAEEAAKWFAKSAHANDDQGKFLYAFTLAKGDGLDQDFEEAYYWLLKTNKSGIPDYDKDVQTLITRLEGNVDPAVLEKARVRAGR